jgi:osmotically-inducible protein OsmY
MKSVIKFVVFVAALLFSTAAQAGVAEYCQQSWTKAKVVTALIIQPGVSAWNTKVTVDENGVALSGVAASEAQAHLTKLVAQRYVSDVKSSIDAPSTGVFSAFGSGTADNMLQLKVYSVLTKKTLINASLKVTCINGCVGLTGTAYSRAEKELAEELARGVSGVTRVVNNVQVVGE